MAMLILNCFHMGIGADQVVGSENANENEMEMGGNRVKSALDSYTAFGLIEKSQEQT